MTPRYRARGRRPIWLAAPGRWAVLGGGRARLMLAAVVLLALAVCWIGGHMAAVDPVDEALDAALVDGCRHGGEFYAVAADGLRLLGLPASVRAIPLPTLFVIQGRMPVPVASALMMMLAVAVVVAWYARFGGALAGRGARGAALALMLLGVAVTLRPSMLAVPEGWAGLLVALSLARRAPGRVVEPAALGLAAAVLAPAALAYAAVMAAFGLGERHRREAIAWVIVLATGGATVALHAHAVVAASATGPVAAAAGYAMPADVMAALVRATGLRLLPPALGAAATALAAFGWLCRRDAGDLRVAALIGVAAALVAVLAVPDAALLVAPLLPLGLLALPDAIRTLLAAAALGRRRITVTRLVR